MLHQSPPTPCCIESNSQSQGMKFVDQWLGAPLVHYASLRETDHAANQVVSEGANLAFASTAYEIVSMHVYL